MCVAGKENFLEAFEQLAFFEYCKQRNRKVQKYSTYFFIVFLNRVCLTN